MDEKIIIREIGSVMKKTAGMEGGQRRTTWERIPGQENIVAYKLGGINEHTIGGKSYIARPDSVFFINAEDTYKAKVREFGPTISAHFLTDEPIRMHFMILDGNTIPQIKADFLQLYKAYNRRDEYSWCECTSALYAILAKIQRGIDSHDSYIQHQKYGNIIRARDYLAENYNNPALSLDAAAAIAEVSSRHFGELFRRLYHVTPGQYITRLRICAAEDMLRMKSYTVAEIAEAVGYASASYFCRVFTRETGVPPSRFMERG